MEPKYVRTDRRQQATRRVRVIVEHQFGSAGYQPFVRDRARYANVRVIVEHQFGSAGYQPFVRDRARYANVRAERAARAAAERKEQARFVKRGLRASRAMIATRNTQTLTIGSTQPPNRRARKNAERTDSALRFLRDVGASS